MRNAWVRQSFRADFPHRLSHDYVHRAELLPPLAHRFVFAAILTKYTGADAFLR
jgi:hypothetical protein